MGKNIRSAIGFGAPAFAAVVLIGMSAGAQPPSARRSPIRASCRVEGVWELVSLAFGEREMGPGSRPARKIVSGGHFIWIGADARRDTLPLRTSIDSLRATQIVGGAGTYTTTDSTFTQHIDMFVDASAEGTTIVSSCRTTGDLWSYAYITTQAPGAVGQPTRVKQVWRRVR